MSSWPKVTTDQGQTSDPEKRQRPGWIPRLLDINPYKSIQKSSYSPQDSYSKDHEDGNSFEELFGQQYHPSTENEINYERHQHPQKDDSHTKDAHRDKLYRQFYQQIEKEYNRERPSDCVIVSISKDQAEYSTAIGHRLQDHGLVVEMIYLTSESGLTRALQEVKNDGSPFCVLVEPSNVTLSSCTVIMLHQTIKIHRNMPMEDALALIAKEFEEIFAEHEQQQRTEISHRAADLADGFLERELYENYHVPLGIRHLLFLLSEGKHLYVEELNSISDYLKTRRNKLEGFVAETNTLGTPGEDGEYPNARPSGSALPPTLSKPPPLLPTPGRTPVLGQSAVPSPKPALLGKRPLGALLPTPGKHSFGTHHTSQNQLTMSTEVEPVNNEYVRVPSNTPIRNNSEAAVPPGPKGKPPPLLTKIIKRPMHLAPPHVPAKRPLLGSRPGLLPTPTYSCSSRSTQHPWSLKPKFLA